MPPRREKRERRPKHRNRYTAEEVLTIMHRHNHPMDWRELVRIVGADDAGHITQLRRVVRGLERGGELARDQMGLYHIKERAESRQVRLERRGKKLYAEGVEVEQGPRSRLRAGDLVETVPSGDTVSVLGVVEHGEAPLTGILNWKGRYPYVEGLGEFRGRIGLQDPPRDARDGDTVLVRVIGEDRRGLVGDVVETIEGESVLEQAISTAIVAHDLPHEWPEPIARAVARLPRSVQANRHPDRENLSEYPFVTIDGETAKDFDDAVYAEKSGNRGWRLMVAIADVAHYVKTGSAIDLEAQQRGTSVYFPERVIPMLPEELSNGLCSLRPDVDRLVLYCDMQIDARGEVVSYEFNEGVIHSHARLTYTQVEEFLNSGKGLSGEVASSVETLNEVFDALAAARERRGALDFATSEAVIQIENGRASGLEPVKRLKSHQLIEEAMIAANVCAARFLEASFEEYGSVSLYRVHEPPDPEKLEELRQVLAAVGIRMPKGSIEPGVMQQSLARLADRGNAWIYGQLALRTLQQAVYTPVNKGHYGLALERYMHFTSPIRRYPDLLVHRAIKQVLARQRGERKNFRCPVGDELHYLGETCSGHERRAESASWMVEGWLKCQFLEREIGQTLSGVVAGVTEFGLFVELKGYFVQGLLHVSSLGEDYFQYQPRTMSLVGESSGRAFKLGDELKVLVEDVSPAQGRVNLELPKSDNSVSARRRRGRR